MSIAKLENINSRKTDVLIDEKRITQNGIYVASNDGLDGYDKVEVDIDMQDIYDEGVQAANDAFWDSYQKNGNRTDTKGMFMGAGWNADTLKPKYSVVADSTYMMFAFCGYNGDLADVFDNRGLSLSFDLKTSDGYQQGYLLYNSKIKAIGAVDLSQLKSTSHVPSMFNTAFLETIRSLVPPKCAMQASCWGTGLKNLGISGDIVADLNVSRCTQLTHDSLMSIINALEDKNPEKTIKGRWILNENLVWQDWMDDYITVFDEHQFGFGYTFNINYTYKGTSQTSLDIGNRGIGYSIRLVQLGSFSNNFYTDNPEWQIAANRTIDFGNAPVSMPEHFYEFITANATSDGGEILNNNSATYTATLGAANLAKLTESEIAIATQKGWTLA